MSQGSSFSTDDLIIPGSEVNPSAEDATLIGLEPTSNEPAAPETAQAWSDTLSRHLTTQNGEPRHHCPLPCDKKGWAVFHRLGHLKQHFVGYHKCNAEEVLRSSIPVHPQSDFTVFPVCYFQGCPVSRNISFHALPQEVQEQTKPFATNAEYYKHMRTAHNWSDYPCSVPGCDRIGANGYFRKKDLVRHHRLEHSSEIFQEI
ncbi:hypothetical protein QQZ08_007526 [Neonectria magnoliae]|uniref:C2H2-type domain-containing protein n=1 Tax=Neonectria magnoliae TaxID=2732573 RepID=A0ABR1HYR6_9HYPO